MPHRGDYFLVVGEVTVHMNTELALAAALRAGTKVVVVGDGHDLNRLCRRFPNAVFVGRVADRRLMELYRCCRALVVPAIEEFGITMVEALATGRPVIAAGRGGAREIVEDGVTGTLFPPGDVEALAEALRETGWECFDVVRLKQSAARFSPESFRQRLVSAISTALRSEGVTSPTLTRTGAA